MGQFAPEKVKDLNLTEGRFDHKGCLKKVFSKTKNRWLLVSMFPTQSQNILRMMFQGDKVRWEKPQTT